MQPFKLLNENALTALKTMPDESIQTCITSPPYFGLRDYNHPEQIGLEETPEQYVQKLVEVFREVRRVLRADGTLWLNLGDSYASRPQTGDDAWPDPANPRKGATRARLQHHSIKPKDLIGIPWMVAFALRADGWYLRSDIIWQKPNPMPESVTDRPTKCHEYIFLLSKSERYYYDHYAIREPAIGGHSGAAGMFKRHEARHKAGVQPGNTPNHRPDRPERVYSGDLRNKRTVWTVNTRPFKEAHFATFPEELIAPCILAGAPAGGVVLDPFNGSGTTGVVALKAGRQYVGIELNPEYCKITERRLKSVPTYLFQEAQ